MYTAFFISRKIRKSDKKAFTYLVQKIGIISIALGLATLIIAFLVIKGFQQNIQDKLTNFQGQLQIFKYSLNPIVDEAPIYRTQIQDIKKVFCEHIQDLQAFAHKTVLIQAKDNLEGIVLKGVDLNHIPTKFKQYLVAGSPMINLDTLKYNNEIILSSHTAARLDVDIGDSVIICVFQQKPRYRKLKVVGLYSTYIEDIDKKIGLCDLRLLQHLNGWSEELVGGYDVFLKHKHSNKLDKEQLLDWLSYDLDVKSIYQAYPELFDWLAIMKKDIIIFLTLILLVANSNIICIVLIQIMERTNMISLLKSMGATNKLIYHVLLLNNIHLIFRGMGLGNLIGLGIALLQYYFKLIKLNPTYYYINYLPVVWDLKIVLGLNIILFILVVFVLLLSIGIIATIRPIKGIRLR